MEKKTPNIVIFASGSGTNAENIIRWAQSRNTYRVTAVLCNRRNAFVLTRAENLGIPHYTFTSAEFSEGTILHKGEHVSLLHFLSALDTDYIILAGFLLKVPDFLIEAYPGKILNIHPALLPSYGGKGMYGDHVHSAVIAAGEKESGITIHLVDNHYDHGQILYQAKCPVMPDDTPHTLFERVHGLEKAYPEVIEKYIMPSAATIPSND